jgi:Uma2 family endonuclease
MSVPLHKVWTQEEFFTWAVAQEGRFEFDGVRPISMTGGTVAHEIIVCNLYDALRGRLRAGPCRPFGPNAGVATIGSAVRYPDALITCSKQDPKSRKIVGAVVVFEVVSESGGGTDRNLMLREYAAVPSILRYVLLESTLAGLTVHARPQPGAVWGTSTLTAEDSLHIPEVDIEIPLFRAL